MVGSLGGLLPMQFSILSLHFARMELWCLGANSSLVVTALMSNIICEMCKNFRLRKGLSVPQLIEGNTFHWCAFQVKLDRINYRPS